MRHKYILIVDDHAVMREGAALMLRQADPDIQVQQAKHPDDAWVKVRAAKPDLIFLDVIFEGEPKGLTFLEALKESSEYGNIPVIIMTGNELTTKEIQDELFARHAAGYMSKSSVDSAEQFRDALMKMENGRVVLDGGRQIPLPSPAWPPKASLQDPIPAISDALMRVLYRVVRGVPYKCIARELDIAESTVREHVAVLLKRFQSPNSRALAWNIATKNIRVYDPPRQSSSGAGGS